ncbi:hypothetical protein ABFS83_07G062000 [Erythranthe nasuta]
MDLSSTSSSSFDLSFGSTNSQFDRDQLSSLQRCRLIMNYTDLTLDHSKWKTMLPPDKDELIWSSAYSLRFFPDKRTGKNCFLLGASRPRMRSGRGFEFMPSYFKSRFPEVAVLKDSGGVEIYCKIKATVFSPATLYAAYLVFDFIDNYEKPQKAISTVEIVYGMSDNGNSKERERIVEFEACNNRSDGWMEIQLGEFDVGEVNYGNVFVQLLESSGCYIVEGIEFRPLEKEKDSIGKGIFSKIKIW